MYKAKILGVGIVDKSPCEIYGTKYDVRNWWIDTESLPIIINIDPLSRIGGEWNGIYTGYINGVAYVWGFEAEVLWLISEAFKNVN